MSDIGMISSMSVVEIALKIEDLEQQLSNSTPNAAIKELIEEEMKRIEPTEHGQYDSLYQSGARYVLNRLNKLLANKEGG